MDILMQGIVLMVIGMATVFSFLVLLILAMNVSAAFFKKYAHLFPDEERTSAAGDRLAPIAIALAAIRAKRG
jgi:sodium pump decarboxylase gamma subunit